ncbi:MAG: hypothetical protein ACLQVI_07095 [Polyangiaceae bacterium]|jgi:hypothetical protein
MTISLRRAAPRYPPLLQAQVSHAHRLAHALRALHTQTSVDDAAFLWLEGRSEEIIVFTLEVVRAWTSGELTVTTAVRTIDDYLSALHGALACWYGRWYAPSCCGPLSRPAASRVLWRPEPALRRRADTMSDVLGAELTVA